MAVFHSFEEIDAWQESRLLVRAIRSICKREQVRRDFAFSDQITRAARSISANIAEGFECMTTKEFINFLSIAKRSSGEVRAHLYDALDEEYISEEEFKSLAEKSKKICRIIAGLIHYLQTIDNKQRRTIKTRKPITSNQ